MAWSSVLRWKGLYVRWVSLAGRPGLLIRAISHLWKAVRG
jgi:hypothetical protein